ERPQMGPVSTGLGEVLHYLVLSEGRDLTELRTLQNWNIKPALRPVQGTAEVNGWGGFEKQDQVRIDPNKLLKYEASFEEAVRAGRANNLNVGGGSLNRGGEMLLIHGVGRTNTRERLQNIVVAARGGTPVLLRDVADVAIGHEIRRGAVTANGQGEAVLGLGFMLMGE